MYVRILGAERVYKLLPDCTMARIRPRHNDRVWVAVDRRGTVVVAGVAGVAGVAVRSIRECDNLGIIGCDDEVSAPIQNAPA